MGFDVYCTSELSIRKEDAERARKIVEEYHASMKEKEYYRPGIKEYDHGSELVMYDLEEGGDDGEEIVGWLHNDTLYELMHPLILDLRDAGVPVTGWIYQNFEDAEITMTYYVDGHEIGYLNEFGLARMCMRHILNDGRIDPNLVNKPFTVNKKEE